MVNNIDKDEIQDDGLYKKHFTVVETALNVPDSSRLENKKEISDISFKLRANHQAEDVDMLSESFHSNHVENKECTLSENVMHNDDVLENSEIMDVALEAENAVLENQESKTNTDNEYRPLVYDWTLSTLLTSAVKEYQPTKSCENFTKGCQWSPDGTCLLVPADDYRIRIYELPRDLYSGDVSKDLKLPDLAPVLNIKEGGTIYDTCWYPQMSSWEPGTCCFLSASQESPVHLWDAFNGNLRATYRAYNLVDEVEPAISVQFINSNTEIWCGFKNALRIFDTDRPGRQLSTIFLKKDFPNITGLVSCIRENPSMTGLVAFGTYAKSIGLYKDGPICTFQTSSGISQIEFSPCGMKLYSTVRRNNELLCWDLRNPGTVLYSLQGRQADTNQRIHFSVSTDGCEIVSGGTDGALCVWRLPKVLENDEDLMPAYKIQISKDCINGVSLHKTLPIIATSSGRRICDENDTTRDNSVRLYWLAQKR